MNKMAKKICLDVAACTAYWVWRDKTGEGTDRMVAVQDEVTGKYSCLALKYFKDNPQALSSLEVDDRTLRKLEMALEEYAHGCPPLKLLNRTPQPQGSR